MVEKLKGRAAIVTGGGRGIGRAIAEALARHGARLVLVARTTSELDATAREIGLIAAESKTHVLTGDTSQEATAKQAVRMCREAFGEVDILVNAAGINGAIGPFEETDSSEWRRTIEVNLYSAFLFMREVLPFMKARRRGKIINLSGGGSANPRPMFSAYAVSKAAVVRLTETVAAEVRDFNVQINALAPGGVNTRLTEEMLAAGKRVGEAEYKSLRDQQKSGGVPADRAAELAVFLASDDSNGITGRMISAVWDDWKSWGPDRIREIESGDLYTLRRIRPPN